MTAPRIADPAGPLGEALSEASPDLMRSLLQTVINALSSADADAVAGATWGQRSVGRTSQRNGLLSPTNPQDVDLIRRLVNGEALRVTPA